MDIDNTLNSVHMRLTSLDASLSACRMELGDRRSIVFSACVSLWEAYGLWGKVRATATEHMDLWFPITPQDAR